MTTYFGHVQGMHPFETKHSHSEYYIQSPYPKKAPGFAYSRMSEDEPIVRPHVNDVLMVSASRGSVGLEACVPQSEHCRRNFSP